MDGLVLSKPLDEVGVIGLVTWLEEGEFFCSLDRIFFRNPRVGIGRAAIEVETDQQQRPASMLYRGSGRGRAGGGGGG